MKKIIYLLIIFFISNTAFANIIITKFDQYIKFTEFGRGVTIKMKVRIEADRNTYYSEWSYIFDKKLKVEVFDAKIIGKQFRTLFGNNELKFQFGKAFNGEQMEFEFKYTQFNQNDVKYTRHEYVSLPAFTKDAEATLIVEVPNSLAVYSINPKFIQNSNIYTWTGKVPSGGIFDFFYLTLRKAKWNVEVLTNIIGKEKISKIDVAIPTYFKNGNNIIDNYNIQTNFDKLLTTIKEDDENIDINFKNINGSMVQVKVDAILKNDFDNKVWIKLDPSKYLEIDEKLSRDLYNTIYTIQSNNKEQLPLYVLLAKWVNKHIEYDMDYLGKDMDVMKILSTGRGVCIHYAILYNNLLRTVGIPSVIVSGVSYDTEKNKFENHAWNLLYTNGEWISIDPTWGLYSGKLPVSHIFFYFGNRPVVEYIVYGTSIDDFSSDIKKNIEFLE